MSEKDTIEPIFNAEKFNSKYKVNSSVLARGRYARIKRCTCNQKNDKQLCVKEIMKSRAGKNLTQDVRHEVAILQMAKRQNIKNILTIIDAFDEMKYYLVLEFCSGGELFDHLPFGKEYNPKLHTISNYKRAMRQIADGLEWMHDRNILHLDLKPQNILLNGPDFTTATFVIADFGLSRFLHEDRDNLQLMVGTPGYCAPEVLKYQALTLAADIFSLGCCFYVIVTGEMPFDSDDENKKDFAQNTFTNIEFLKESYALDFFKAHESAQTLLENMLKKKPADRISIKQVIQHCFLTESNKIKSDSTASKTTIDSSFSYNSDSSKDDKALISPDDCFITDEENIENKLNGHYLNGKVREGKSFIPPLKPANRRQSKRPAEEMLPRSPPIMPSSKKSVL